MATTSKGMSEGEVAKLFALMLATWTATAARLDPGAMKETVAAYHAALRDIPGDVALRAFRRLSALSKYLPTPAEIRKAASEITHGARRPPAEAWGDVRKAIGRWGRNRPPGEGWSFEDPLTAAAVDALGWTELCESESPVPDRARFLEVYAQLSEADHVERVTHSLPGAAAPKRIGGSKSVAELAAGVTARMLEEGKKKS